MRYEVARKKIDVIELKYICGIIYESSNSLYQIKMVLDKCKYILITIENSGNKLSFLNYQTNLIYWKINYHISREYTQKNIDIKNITNTVKAVFK